MAQNENCVIYKDFAHSPSKVQATTRAVHNQYSERKLIACLELHTYSSLNPEFLVQYKNTLDAADVAVVFYSPHAVEIKKLEPISEQQILESFDRDDLIVKTDPADFKKWLFSQNFNNTAILMMSSGNYGGLDFEELKNVL
ncbi:cytoplasmic peptidoglycan synthetase [Nonlabens ulvanivorans]|nr:cytoplasmic peptidoglycan synthetase [Nonlabens ulvanivorans]